MFTTIEGFEQIDASLMFIPSRVAIYMIALRAFMCLATTLLTVSDASAMSNTVCEETKK